MLTMPRVEEDSEEGIVAYRDLRQEISGVDYPPAPWMFQGHAIMTLQLVKIARVRPFMPPELKIVSVLPGRTLGGVFLASYGPGSVSEYNELGVIAALVRYSRRLGLWASHAYVDGIVPLVAGREIWGLPKELAEFTWEDEKHCVAVRQGRKVLCTFNWGRQFEVRRMQLSLPSFTTVDSQLLSYGGEIASQLSLSSGKLVVPPESPFATLGLGGTCLAICLEEISMVVSAPQVVER